MFVLDLHVKGKWERSMSNVERSMHNIYQKVLSHHECQRMIGFLEKTFSFRGVLLLLFYFIKPLFLPWLFLVFWILLQLYTQRAIIVSDKVMHMLHWDAWYNSLCRDGTDSNYYLSKTNRTQPWRSIYAPSRFLSVFLQSSRLMKFSQSIVKNMCMQSSWYMASFI